MKFLVYVAILLSTAACLALGLDFVTRPEPASKLNAAQTEPGKPKVAVTEQAQAAVPGAVRQIPIVGRPNPGDPNNDLSPIYPAAPGKDLAVKDAASAPAPAPVAHAETTGNAAGAEAQPATQASPQASTVASTSGPAIPASPPTAKSDVTLQSSFQTRAAPNSCNVAACSAAYRSFRESDCTYQPFSGPRTICAGPPDAGASPQQAAAQPRAQTRPEATPRETARRGNDDTYDDDLQDATRAVQRLPGPNAGDDDDDGSAVVMRRPPQDLSRYGFRRNWVIERDQ